MLRSLLADRDLAVAPGALDVSPILVAVRSIVLVMVLVTVPLAEPHLGVGAQGIALAVALGVCVAGGVVWFFARGRERVTVATLAVLGVAGGVLAGLSPLSTAIAVGCVVTATVGARLNTEISMAITAATVASFLAAGLATGAPAESLLGYPLTFIGLWALGLTRHAYLLRAEQAEQTLAETRRAREAETEAAALAERARIAREIHDVLAHSLAAVSVNLEAAEALLGTLPTGSPELGKAIECISRASVFTKEGLADARRAILALRDDAAPLPEQLSELVKEYAADGDVPVGFTLHGLAPAGQLRSQPGCLPDGAGGADQRAQARTGPAGPARPGVFGRRDRAAGGQPAAGPDGQPAARRRWGRLRAHRPGRARRAGRGHANRGAGRGSGR